MLSQAPNDIDKKTCEKIRASLAKKRSFRKRFKLGVEGEGDVRRNRIFSISSQTQFVDLSTFSSVVTSFGDNSWESDQTAKHSSECIYILLIGWHSCII